MSLPVCLLTRLLKNACTDLDEMLRRQMSGHGRTKQAVRLGGRHNMPPPRDF